jgi:hypothetical protein
VLVVPTKKDNKDVTAKTYSNQQACLGPLTNCNLLTADHIQIIGVAASSATDLISIPDPATGGCIWTSVQLP